MNLVLDGWLALRQNVAVVAVVAACLMWGSVIVLAALSRSIPAHYDLADLLSLVWGGWILPVLALSVAVLAAGVFLSARPSLAVAAATLGASAAAGILWIRRARGRSTAKGFPALVILSGMFMGLLLVRLAFIARLALPLYFDSAEHYRIIAALIRDYAGGHQLPGLGWPTPTYYHLGSHVVLAVLAAVSNVRLAPLMLVAGQVVLAVTPFPLFLIARHETGSTLAGILTVTLGALGWSMPAYALNWGKYPALLSLPAILFALSAGYLARQERGGRPFNRTLFITALLAASAATLIHTRAIVILSIFVLAWLVAGWWQHTPRRLQFVSFLVTAAVLISVILLVARNTVLAPTMDPYFAAGLWITGLVAFLSVPAFLKSSRLAFSCLLSILFLLVALFLPGLAFANTTLLDRPLVEMALFVPLSFLGAAGFAAWSQIAVIHRQAIAAGSFMLIAATVVLTAFRADSFYPSACCSLVEPDDLVALDWIPKNLPVDAQVLVSSAELASVPAPYPSLAAASDAGAWITPLTGRQTVPSLYWVDFRLRVTLQAVCARRVGYIFAGSAAHSFDRAALDSRPDWYKGILLLPGARIYRVAGCSN